MKIEIKDESKEKALIDRALKHFGYKGTTQFVLAAIVTQYRMEVDAQLEKAAIFRNKEIEENPEYMHEMHQLQGVE